MGCLSIDQEPVNFENKGNNTVQIINPILPGFNPDPSILRVGDDYYIATSTFEWFPGVQIHHSRDLVNWRLLTRPLTRVSQLDLRGVGPSAGIWAPCLTYADGLFWLIYTIVNTVIKDQHNYLVTAPSITGPWSEPVYLNSLGFDPSLFHDDDGRKYFVQMAVDQHRRQHFFKGIYLTEYDPKAGKLVGPTKQIFHKFIGATEGPHLYKHGGFYHLLVAEGGTGYDHAVTMARSRSLWGPYEVDPGSPILTSRQRPDLALQKAGHASLVETSTDEWYLAHLCGRPMEVEIPDKDPQRRCIRGRETALQRAVWNADGWLRLADGGTAPSVEVPAPALPPHPFPPEPATDHFDAPTLGVHWSFLREPATPDWANLTERPGHLRLYGRESLQSRHHVSLAAQRIATLQATYETAVDYAPATPWQMAGLTMFYCGENYYFLAISRGDDNRRRLLLLVRDNGRDEQILPDDGLAIPEEGCVRLAARLDGARLRFAWAIGDAPMQDIGPELDASILSDENACGGWGFTGAFVGICALDLSGTRQLADFDYFNYSAMGNPEHGNPAASE
jgi:xylan 1,4-beta-xylosidase